MLLRFRDWVLISLFALGFWAPFERMGGAHPGTTWLALAGWLARSGILPITGSSIAVMAAAILLLVLAALLRTWAAAYRPDRPQQGDENAVTAAGPYRYLRHPSCLGLFLHTLALAILMPPWGAVFTVVSVSLLIAALIPIEEKQLAALKGESFAAYRRRVPAFFLAWRPRTAASGQRPHWGRGWVSEIYMWGAAATFIGFANRYNATILEQGILISLGVSIVLRGLVRPATQPVSSD